MLLTVSKVLAFSNFRVCSLYTPTLLVVGLARLARLAVEILRRVAARAQMAHTWQAVCISATQ